MVKPVSPPRRSDEASGFSNPELIAEISKHLPQNDIACSLRLVNQATAKLFKNCIAVKLSEPVPVHAFAHGFRSSRALRHFSKAQQLKLLSLTAKSGVLRNLKHILSVTIHYLTGETVDMKTAGEQIWLALREHGGYTASDIDSITESAAAGGHRVVCRWLLDKGCSERLAAVCGAVQGGRQDLLTELRQQGPLASEADKVFFLLTAAKYWGLTELQRLCREEFPGQHSAFTNQTSQDFALAVAAAGLPSDWRDKVEWLEAQGCRPCGVASSEVSAVCSAADTVERLSWLRGRGYPMGRDQFAAAARFGNLTAIKYMLDGAFSVKPEAAPPNGGGGYIPAWEGSLATQQVRDGNGGHLSVMHALREALQKGHQDLVAWLVETFSVGQEALRRQSSAAACSSSLALLRWMDERGVFQANDNTMMNALQDGVSEEVAEWLAAHGCALWVDPSRLAHAHHHLAMLRCLRRMGWRSCDMGLKEICLMASRRTLSVPTLKWLQRRGCRSLREPILGEQYVRFLARGASKSSLDWLASRVRSVYGGTLVIPHPSEWFELMEQPSDGMGEDDEDEDEENQEAAEEEGEDDEQWDGDEGEEEEEGEGDESDEEEEEGPSDEDEEKGEEEV